MALERDMMNKQEAQTLQYISYIEAFMFENCNTYEDRENVRELVDDLNKRLILIVGNRIIKESRKNG